MQWKGKMNEYVPLKAVWEITFACNMNCGHCGSRCGEVKPDELTEAEALELCRQLGELGLMSITLSGGEPLMRPDWDKIAAHLRDAGVVANILTNGWYIDEDIVARARAAGVPNFGISVDGLKETHDFIRRPGSFDRICSAMDLLNRENMPISVITSINRQNIGLLSQMKEFFYRKNVASWQLQIALPMGNLADRPEWVLDPEHIEEIIDFAYDATQEGVVVIELGDCLGYYRHKDVEIRKKNSPVPGADGLWRGCPAGKFSFGIRCNGDITACNSLRDTDTRYIEGNIRQKTLREIWNSDGAFALHRGMSKDKLSKFCGKCLYGEICLGGCTSLKETMTGGVSFNPYCLYYIAANRDTEEIEKITDLLCLLELAGDEIRKESYQVAELYLERARRLKPDNISLLNTLGFVHYQLGNYQACIAMNRETLRLEPGNTYAHKGLGIGLAAIGQVEEGIRELENAVQLADAENFEPIHDLAVVLIQYDRPRQALDILEKGRRKFSAYPEQIEDICRQLRGKL
jgi:radical SAM protein with 4Fe4S-binding SPASM domain